MEQSLTQVQREEQQLLQQQRLSALHVLYVKLLELPNDALQQRVENECLENPWLEKSDAKQESADSAADKVNNESDYNQADDYRSEDDTPAYLLHQASGSDAQLEHIDYGDSLSFYDKLKEQIGEYNLDEHKRTLMEYLIGSLDSDGLLKISLDYLADELSIYHYIDTTPKELEDLLHVLWQFDPPGIGARSLQECLRIQIERKSAHPLYRLMLDVIENSWDDFMHKRWDAITHRMRLTPSQASALMHELQHLNPRPGTSLGEPTDKSMQQIMPDFIVEIDGYGNLSLSLNNSGIPDLVVSADATEKLATYAQQKPDTLSLSAREDIRFTRKYVERGQLFINALEQRNVTMLRTMEAIMRLQRTFFLEGDETKIRPMGMEDVAQRIGVDVSTVSRVCNNKYVQTDYGIYPLQWFFSQKIMQSDGDALSGRQVKALVRELIESEDKRKPYSDNRLMILLKQRGFDVARRTITKYREAMGYPTSRMRVKL